MQRVAAHGQFSVANSGIVENLIGGEVSDNRWGWMWGAGLEYAFAANWSAKVEYNYLDFGTKDYFINDAPVFDITTRIHLVKFGINHRFGYATY